MNNAIAKIEAKIAKEAAKIADYNFGEEHFALLEKFDAISFQDKIYMILGEEGYDKPADWDAMDAADNARSALKSLESYEETLKQIHEGKIIDVRTSKYVLTDGNLISPAGFHPHDGFFSTTGTCMVQVDELPKASNLGYYESSKVTGDAA